jgi:hypothetical protein
VIQWKDIRDVFFLNTVDEDVLVEAPSSRGAHHKMKPAAVLNYKYSVERSDQMLSHYSFERTTKLWRKLFFRLFNLVMVNAQILHNKSSKKNICCWKFAKKKSPKGILLASDRMEIHVQDQTSSPASRLIQTDHSIYSIPVTHAKLAGKSQLSFLVSAEKVAPDWESCEDVLLYNILPKMLCRTLCWAVF